MTAEKQQGRSKERVGLVVSDKMSKTVVVKIERRFSHPLYRKIIRRTKNYYAHDETNNCNEGDMVRIVETRPMSKNKRWRVSAVINRAK